MRLSQTQREHIFFFCFFSLGEGAQMVPSSSTVPVKLSKMNTGNETSHAQSN